MTSIERQRIDLKQEMVDYLEAQGIAGTSGITGNKLADEIAEVVLRDCLDLSADAVEDASEFQEFDLIIAFAFGHRFEANGNRAPGPVNERLAREVERRYQARPRENRPRVWAQWEVGECLRGSVVETEGSLHVVHPEISVRRDTVAYASTISVAESVRASLSTDSRHCALVVAHPDHLRRCVWAVNDQ